MDQLPADIINIITQYLPTYAVITLACTNKTIHKRVTKSKLKKYELTANIHNNCKELRVIYWFITNFKSLSNDSNLVCDFAALVFLTIPRDIMLRENYNDVNYKYYKLAQFYKQIYCCDF